MNALTRLLVPLVSIALSLGCESASAPRADGTALGARVAVSILDSRTAIAHEYYSGFGAPAQLVVPMPGAGRTPGRSSMPVSSHSHRSQR